MAATVNVSVMMMELVNYSSYGVPIGLPAGDTDSDGDCDQSDINTIDNWVSGYDVRYDLDLDGDVDAADSSRASSTFQGTTLGWGVLSSSSVGNRKGYAGYEWDEAVSKYHVRNRILDPALGRWTRRDPIGYVDGMSLYEYVNGKPLRAKDAFGLFCCCQGAWLDNVGFKKWKCTKIQCSGGICLANCNPKKQQICPGKYFCYGGACDALRWVKDRSRKPTKVGGTCTTQKNGLECCTIIDPDGKTHKLCDRVPHQQGEGLKKKL